MGCDIHIFAEVLNNNTGDWEITIQDVPKVWGNPVICGPWEIDFDDYRVMKRVKENGWLFVWDNDTNWLTIAEEQLELDYEKRKFDIRIIDWDCSRNYALFNILAGVRSGWGSDFTIAAPRGIPDNCSPEYQYMVDSWDCDGHSHSFLYLKELEEYLDKEEFPYFYKLMKELKSMVEDTNDARFVFFFDN